MQSQDPSLRIHAGKVALVTGSSDARGIGIEVARGLAKRGCSIILSGTREPEKVAQLMEGVKRDYDVAVHYMQTDFTVPSLIKKLHEDIKQIYPDGVDILVNNAGIYVDGNLVENNPLTTWDNVVAVMLTANFHLTKLMLPDMKRKGWGRIINTNNLYGCKGLSHYCPYAAVAHGVNGVTKTVALETRGTGVTCNAVAIGFADTRQTAQLLEEANKQDKKDQTEGMKVLLDDYSFGFVSKTEIADLMAFLCSPTANKITGTTLPMDVGKHAE